MDCTFLWLRGEEGERWFFNQLKLIEKVAPPKYPHIQNLPPNFCDGKKCVPPPTPLPQPKKKRIDKGKYKYKRINAIETNNVTFYS